MNGHQEDGFRLHWGCVILAVVLTAGAVVVVLILGWRWLWLIPAAAVAFWMFMFAVNLFEDRWRTVTPHHVRRGVPPRCTACGAEWSAILAKNRFKARCPICGHRETGSFIA